MTVSDMHAAAVSAYREALAGSSFEGIKIRPIDRETKDIERGIIETEYDADYGRQMLMKVITVHEDLFYYAKYEDGSRQWKIETNEMQELIVDRLLCGLLGGEVSVEEIDCESADGVLHISFSVVFYEVKDFDGRETAAETMENLETTLEIETL